MSNNFQQDYSRYKVEVEKALADYTSTSCSGKVEEAARYSLLLGGKRIRAVLALAVCEMLTGDYKPALPIGVAIEMVHAYSLIHDDLPCMDDDDMRRGQLSCHKKYGESTALLAGDALLTRAFGVLSDLNYSEKALECVEILSKSAGSRGMILGQELDLAAEGQAVTKEQLDLINKNKTGRLIAAPVSMAAVVSGASEEQRTALEKYAEKIGVVFQIVDDILDISSTTEQLGKSVGSDEKNDKTTYAVLFGIEASERIAKQLTVEAVESLSIFDNRADFLKEFAYNLAVRKN